MFVTKGIVISGYFIDSSTSRSYIEIHMLPFYSNSINFQTNRWSTSVPNYDPRDVINNIKKLLNGEEMAPMKPAYRGFTGEIAGRPGVASHTTYGIINKLQSPDAPGNENKLGVVEITELPIKIWTSNYKEWLNKLMDAGIAKTDDKGNKINQIGLVDVMEYHTDTTVQFVLQLTEDGWNHCNGVGWHTALKLKSTVSTTNMVAWDADGVGIKAHKTALEIISVYYPLRLDMYSKRKEYQLSKLLQQEKILSEQQRYIKLFLQKKIVVKKTKIEKIVEQLLQENFEPMSKLKKMIKLPGKSESDDGDDEADAADAGEDGEGDDDGAEDDDEEDGEEASGGKKKSKTADWDYLVGMPISSLTNTKITELSAAVAAKKEEREALEKIDVKDVWRSDLAELETAIDAEDKFYESEWKEAILKITKPQELYSEKEREILDEVRKAQSKGKKRGLKTGAEEDDLDLDDDGDVDMGVGGSSSSSSSSSAA